MDPKRRKTQDSAENVDSSAADTGNSGVAESKATDSKAKPVELNAEAEKRPSIFGHGSNLSEFGFRWTDQNGKRQKHSESFHKQQLEQRRGRRPVQIIYLHPLHKEVEELNRKKDIVCLILSYPPMNSMNKERHENWVRDVLWMNHKVREWKTFSSKKNKVLDSDRCKIYALLDHKFDDIEAYVPPLIIEEMCKKTLPVAVPDEKVDASSYLDIKVGSEWWNSENIQKIVCTTRSQKVCQRMAVDREIRLDDHLLSWELFCRNVGNIVHSSGFQHRATDVVQKCSGHLLAVVLMARALNMVFNVSTWEHASYLLSLPHRSQMEDRVLYNALAFIMGRCSGSAHECVKYCAFYMEREGANKLDLIQEWIRHALISTFDEGQKMVRGLVSAFLLESSQNGYSVRMRDEIHEVLVNSQFLLQGGKGLAKAPTDEAWEEATEIHLMNNKFSELPRGPNCPQLCALFLQKNPFLRVIPPSFFQRMPMLQILDLSHTKIRSLPQSLYGLSQLQRLFLRGCKLFMELPPEVRELSNLKVLHLKGTEIIRLPMDVGKLTNLTCLKMSFYGDNDNKKDNQYSNRIIPQSVMSNLFQLEELIIDVNPDDKQWNANVKDIVEEVCSLNWLEALQLYFPEVSLLNNLMDGSSINLPGMHFRFTVGNRMKGIISRLPLEAAIKFEEQERCLKYVNGEGVPTEIKELLQLATALFLDRHLTATSLSEFGIKNMGNLKFCVLGECAKIQTMIDAYDGDVTFCLFDLEELVVEDCPKIESIVVTHDPTATVPMLWRGSYLFPKLRKISLHYMPKLEVHSNDLKVIIVEAKWWRELNWNKSKWLQPPNLDAIFHPIEQDTYFVTHLAEIDDQLQARMQETELSQQSGPGDSLKAPTVEDGTSSKQKQVA
ncbi:putative disease resistance protein [Vitis vinifera]|uniref:Putative disease resistance protein n=1 Tax=Vitis vinifera TaxID=29760 RepID=A0A438E9D8_VITVI|nr:putative disease resistance protein [Vitis vinifera]